MVVSDIQDMAGFSKISDSSPAASTPTLKKSTSGSQSSKNQKSILGFFQKRATDPSQTSNSGSSKPNGLSTYSNEVKKKTLAKIPVRGSSQSLTPAPSSDALEELDVLDEILHKKGMRSEENGLPSPITPVPGVGGDGSQDVEPSSSLTFSSPSRQVSILACQQPTERGAGSHIFDRQRRS